MPVGAEKNACSGNVGASTDSVNGAEYLSTLSPRDKPWDRHRSEADQVEAVYTTSAIRRHQRYGERVAACSQTLEFARSPPAKKKPQKFTLKNSWFCRVRHCPVCQWRRALRWQAMVYAALPRLMKDYPRVRFLFMTLTIRNCPVERLRETLKLLCSGWDRLTKLRGWPAIGWVRSVEITRGKDGSAHPHFHCLLMVHPGYFQADYLSQKQWAELWGQSLRVNYTPVIDIRIVKPDHKLHAKKVVPGCNIWGAVVEILKYSVKPGDMVKDHEWFLTLVDQVWKTKAVIVGGVFKKYIREREPEDLTSEPGQEASTEKSEQLFFGWKREVRKYRRLQS
jgi:plasmid rolling circle replication initiator protein Rep